MLMSLYDYKERESTQIQASRTCKATGDTATGLENRDRQPQGPDSVPATECRIFSGGHREVSAHGHIS